LDSEIDLIGRFSHHLSLYELEVYRSTQLGKSVRDRMVKMPLEKEQIRGYELALIALQSQGFSRYEVSNFAREEAAQSQHNLHVWQGKQYLGLGLFFFSFLSLSFSSFLLFSQPWCAWSHLHWS
jgi:oxygen-independent coproporphyrinogen-3 oxidase